MENNNQWLVADSNGTYMDENDVVVVCVDTEYIEESDLAEAWESIPSKNLVHAVPLKELIALYLKSIQNGG